VTRARRDDLMRLAVAVAGLAAAIAIVSLLFAAAGRPARQSIAAGTGLAGLVLAVAGLVMLVIARGRDGRITHATAIGALGVALVLLLASLVI